MSRRRAILGVGAVAVPIAAVLVLVADPGGTGLTPAVATRAGHRPAPVAGDVPAGPPPVTPRRLEHPAWTRASVATVWLRPAKARPVDRPALRPTPDIDRWVHRQTLAEREALTGRVLTQAVRGEPVRVIRERDGWSRVRLPRQRGSYFRTGIVGWVPSGQLSEHAPRGRVGTAAARPVRPASDVGTTALADARRYLGVRYLWGGMTRRGIDCSGLTYQAFRSAGRTLPRDAADQARVGQAVDRDRLRPGDLVFFGPRGWTSIHHVGIYAGAGLVLHAPYTGSAVRLTPLSAWPDYWGARRLR